MSSRTTVMFRFRVHDYEAFKAVFDDHEEARVRHGGVGHRILRDAQDALALTVLVDFTSLGGATGFVKDIADLRPRGQRCRGRRARWPVPRRVP